MSQRVRRPRSHHARFLAYQLRQALEREGMTIHDLSRETGIERSQITMLFSGKRLGTYEQWAILLRAAKDEPPPLPEDV